MLELEMTATDEVLPVLKELQQEVSKLGPALDDWPGKATCRKWHAKLITASELSEAKTQFHAKLELASVSSDDEGDTYDEDTYASSSYAEDGDDTDQTTID